MPKCYKYDDIFNSTFRLKNSAKRKVLKLTPFICVVVRIRLVRNNSKIHAKFFKS